MRARHAQDPQHSTTCREAGLTAHGAEAAGPGAGAGMDTGGAGALKALKAGVVVVALTGTTEGTGAGIGEEARGVTCRCSRLLDHLYCPSSSGGLRATLQLQDSTKGTHQVCQAGINSIHALTAFMQCR